MIHDHRICDLGEGPLWHPIREELFWFDILNNKQLSQDATGPREWLFDRRASAAGWINPTELLVATETGLIRLDLETGTQTAVAAVEADQPDTRSNDGRADPLGGFWFGTMGKQAQAGAGSIYRFYRGEVRRLFKDITISNSICFPPEGAFAYFSDTALGRVMRVALDAEGWPKGQPETFLDLTAEGLNPDGAVVDASGVIWLAQWGAGRVAAYAPDGGFLRAVPVDAPHSSCPAFGGAGLSTLYCTTALQDMDAATRALHPDAGKVFAIEGVATGQREHMVIL
jgi:sugar lactone lactonase YvrE